MKKGFTVRWGAIAACLVIALAGCATRQARKVEKSGFLGNYSELHERKEGEALLVYVDRSADWKHYTKILFDPVMLWHDGNKSNLPADEVEVLLDYLDASLRDTLKSDYEFVDRPGPGVIRLRVALTEAVGSKVRLESVSNVVPGIRALSGMKRVDASTAAFVGEAGIEAEIVDSTTNRRLAAAVDRRYAAKNPKPALDRWEDVNNVLDDWSARLKKRLAELRRAHA